MKRKFFYTFFIILSLFYSCKRDNIRLKQEIPQNISFEEKKIDSIQSYSDVLTTNKANKIALNKEVISFIKNESKKNSTGIPFIFYFFIILVIAGIIFFLTKLTGKIVKLKTKIGKIEKNIQFANNGKNKISKEIIEIKKQINELRESLRILGEQKNNSEKAIIYNFENKPKVNKKEKKTYTENDILYAGKLNSSMWDKVFTKQKVDSLYILENIGGDKFLFSIIDNLPKSLFLEVANRPEQNLYNACKDLNSNQLFKSKIITVEKGIAKKEEEKYIVERKARIKFE